jgi:VWFA-related protein
MLPQLLPRSWPSRRDLLLAAGSVVCVPCILRAQQQPTFSTNVKVVSVLANVMTKKGEIIRDLKKSDFSISEDGRPQDIQYFSRQSDLPLILGLMVDTSLSQEKVLDSERAACFRFLDRVLRESKDQVFVLQFDFGVMMRQELTSSWKDLNNALTDVNSPSHRELQNQTGGGTVLYDAVLAAAKVMQDRQGRKAVIILSDGVDNGSNATLSDAIDAAQRADTIVFSILYSDPGFYSIPLGFGRSGRGVLEKLSKETGGALFEISKKQTIDQVFDTIQDELRSQYNLGYVSDKPVRISEFRNIRVTVSEKGLIVQARERYWATP